MPAEHPRTDAVWAPPVADEGTGPIGGPPAGNPAPGDRALLAAPARQSPIALVFIAWRFVRRMGLSAIAAAAILVANGGLAIGVGLLAAVAATSILVYSVLSWWRFTFVVDGDELIATRGILSVERLVIPLDRVQSVAIEQQLAHRIVGLVRVSVDTAGSSNIEFEIDAIDAARAEALRRIAADARPDRRLDAEAVSHADAAAGGAADEVLARRSPIELVWVGVTRTPWAGLAILAPLVAVGDELGGYVGLGSLTERLSRITAGIGDGPLTSRFVAVLVVLLVVTIGGAVLQLVRELTTNWDLTLTRTPTGLRRTAGLLSTTSRSSTVRRIQSITTDDAPPQRWLGITHLRLRTFGETDIGLPGARPDEVDMLRSIVFGHAVAPSLDRSISRWYVFEHVRNAAAVAAIAAIPIWFRFGWWAALAIPAVAVQWAIARRRWRLRRWSLDEDRIAESSRFLARHMIEVPLHKGQVVTVSQSFFERRKGLATVSVRTAAGTLAVPLIPYPDAAAVRDRVVYAIETDPRPAL